MSESEPREEQKSSPDLSKYNESQSVQNEAGGVAWAEFYTPKGTKINLTERRGTALAALDALMVAAHFAHERYGLSGVKPVVESPRSAPPASTPRSAPPKVAAATKVAAIQTVKRIRTKKQKEMVVCTSPDHSEPLFAFISVIPSSIDISGWDMFEEYGPPPEMAFAVINPEKNTVVSFQDHG